MRRSILRFLVLGLLLAVARAEDKPTDRDRFGGTWSFVSAERDGEKIPDEKLKDRKLVFRRDGYIARIGDRVAERGTFRLGESESPKTLDFQITEGKDQGLGQLGLYELDGDKLKLCLAKPGAKRRPTGFATEPESGLSLVVLKRDTR